MSSDRVFFFCLLSFLLGIACGLVFPEQAFFLCFLFPAFGLALFVAFRGNFFPVLFFGAVIFSVSLWYASSEIRFWQESFSEKRHEFSGGVRVQGVPEKKDFFQSVLLREDACKEGCLPKKILWEAPLDEKIGPGLRGTLTCALEKPENFSSDFDYRMFLAKEGILWICPKGAGEYVPLPDDAASAFQGILFAPKQNFEQALRKSLPEPEAGLARGLLLGGSGHLPEPLQEAFSRIGLSHIVAVSGYNITLVAELFLVLGIFLGLFRRQALFAACIGIFFFVLLVGAPASAVRAGLMAGVGFIALQAGRLGRPINLLFLAASVMLVFNPLLLRYDIGFQLSFLATLGILFGAPWFERLFPNDFLGKKILEIAWLTFIVELFVVPLLLFYFQTFSWFALFANVLLLPLVPFAMAFSFGAALLFLLLPGAHFVLSFPAYFFLTAVTRFAEFFGTLPWVSLSVGKPPVWSLIVWYALLVGGALILEEKQAKKWYANAFSFPARC